MDMSGNTGDRVKRSNTKCGLMPQVTCPECGGRVYIDDFTRRDDGVVDHSCGDALALQVVVLDE